MKKTWEAIVKFNDKFFPKWRETSELYLSNAMAGEVGEVCNDVKHRAGGGTNKRYVSTDSLVEELADVFIYLVLLCEVNIVNAEEFEHAVEKKIQKNTDRMKAKE